MSDANIVPNIEHPFHEEERYERPHSAGPGTALFLLTWCPGRIPVARVTEQSQSYARTGRRVGGWDKGLALQLKSSDLAGPYVIHVNDAPCSLNWLRQTTATLSGPSPTRRC